MSEAYIMIGGNLGDRYRNLFEAGKKIEKDCGKIVKCSRIYETDAWGDIPQPDFLNQVLLIQTILPANTLMDSLLSIEKEMGRIRNEKFGARTIDLDILFYDDCIMENENVIIPHPRITQRRFVLEPLAEIAPELVDPLSQKKISTLLNECPDQLAVRVFSPNVHNNDH
jgi:2-amino-4-hydroxy-6-hydroxymethyldihydropteridine diphosphokinase